MLVDVEQHRHHAVVTERKDDLGDALLAERGFRGRKRVVADTLRLEQLVAEPVQRGFVRPHGPRPLACGDRRNDRRIEPGLKRGRPVRVPFEVRRPMPRGHQNRHLAQRRREH
jgi:hypothetical protein